MQPQEAINCNRDQLGPSRCPWLSRLCSRLNIMKSGQSFWPGWGNNRAVSFAQQFVPKVSYWQPIKSFIALPLSSPPVLVIRRHNYSPLKKSCFYRGRLISQWPLPHILTPQSLPLIVHHPDGQNQSQSQVHTNCFPHITTTGFLNPQDFSNTSKWHWETHIYCPTRSYTTAQLTLLGHQDSFLLKRCLASFL